MKRITSAIIALAVLSGTAYAQAPAPKAPNAPMAPSATVDPTVDAKFKAADKDGNGVLDGAELTAYKADMVKIDTDKDGKISKAEFSAAMSSGLVK